MLHTFLHHIQLAIPLFVLVFVGFGIIKFAHWPTTVTQALNRFVFVIALPAMLFRLMSDLSKLPPVDSRLLIAFFGGCLVTFALGRLFAWKVFKLDGTAQSIFALGGVFSNNVMLGLPLAKIALGDAALPSVALVLVFNSLTLWTLVTISVEWSRHGSMTLHGFVKTAKSVITNPLIAAILSGTLFGLTGLPLPQMIDAPLYMVAQAGTPLVLIALGMGLAEYGLKSDLPVSMGITGFKLVVQPLVVWLIAVAVGLPAMETKVVVMLASLAVGANVYLMSRQFQSMEAPVAASLIISTCLAAITTPIALTLVEHAVGK